VEEIWVLVWNGRAKERLMIKEMIMKTRSRSRELGSLSNAVYFNITVTSAHAQ